MGHFAREPWPREWPPTTSTWATKSVPARANPHRDVVDIELNGAYTHVELVRQGEPVVVGLELVMASLRPGVAGRVGVSIGARGDKGLQQPIVSVRGGCC